MSGVIEGLFGGSESQTSSQSTQSSQSTSTPTDLTPEAFQNIQPILAQTLSNLFTNTPQFQAPTLAPTANTTATLGNLQGATQPGTNPAWNLINQTLSGGFLPTAGGAAGGAGAGAGVGGNPFLQAAIEAAQRPTRQALEDTLSRTLPGTFTAAGQTVSGGLRSPNANLRPGSTAFDLAAARAFEGGSKALSDIATNMGFQGYNLERGLQNQAVNQALTAGQQDIQALINNLQAQELPNLLTSQNFEMGAQSFNSMVNALLQALQIGGQVTDPTIAQTAQATSTGQSTSTGSQQTNPNIIGTLFPLGI